eukprot:jgi/Chrzof1/11480/UNPLg00412.t1
MQELVVKFDAPMFSLAGKKAYARVTDAHDCDTFKAVFDMMGTGEYFKHIIRVAGVDSPEMTDKNATVKAWAIAARDRMLSLMAPGVFHKDGRYSKKDIVQKLRDNSVVVWLHLQGGDKYNRQLASVYSSPESTTNFQQILIEDGYCKPYGVDGKSLTKDVWTPEQCNGALCKQSQA